MEENHANLHSEKVKEGLSLFGILNQTKTPLGKFLLKSWFQRPSLEISVIKARQNVINNLLKGDNQYLLNTLSSSLRGIKNLPKLLKNLKEGKGTLGVWKDIQKVGNLAITLTRLVITLFNSFCTAPLRFEII